MQKQTPIHKLQPRWQEILKHIPEYESALELTRILKAAGFEAYIIGGAVRDTLLGKTPKDIDVVTNATPEQILEIKAIGKALYKDTSQAYGVTRVHMHGNMLEVATFRRDINAHKGRKQTKVEYSSLKEDIKRRDFTVNALALDLDQQLIIDDVEGIFDLNNKLIRFIGSPTLRIKEDPLRILRAIRLKNSLEFEYEEKAKQAILDATEHGTLQQIATDRTHEEITRMLKDSSREQSLEDLDQFNIIEKLIPELYQTKYIQQPKKYHAEGTVWQHTLLALKNLPNSPSEELVWATLLHDIGKSQTKKGSGEAITFYNHYNVGADIAKEVLKRLNFSMKLIKNITWMIRHHMNIDDMPDMRPDKKFDFISHPAFFDLFELHKADAIASWHREKRKILPKFPEIEQAIKEHEEQLKKPTLKKLGITGDWLIKKFDLKPGPQVGEILKELNQFLLAQNPTSKSQFEEKVKSILNDK